MPKPGKCPGESIYAQGMERVEARGATEAEAEQAMEAQLPDAKQKADKAGFDAYRAALKDGNDGCEGGVDPCEECDAIYLREPDEGPWKAVGRKFPDSSDEPWLARGGYRWVVKVLCECRKPEKKDPEREGKR